MSLKNVKYFLLPVVNSRRKWLFLLFLLAFLLLLSKGFKTLVVNYAELRRLRKEEERLILENRRLREQVEKIKNSEYIEYKAREELGVIKPDEIEYRFRPETDENKAD